MACLFDQAKKHQALVIGTSNKSEILLGYYTRYGDSACDLKPLSHLYKTQVYQLAKFLNIPQAIIKTPPSANLWPGQTDAQELGFTYQLADPILYLLTDKKLTPDKIIKQGFDKSLVNKVHQRLEANKFKTLVPYELHQG
jgi:NAD+ synthase